MGKYLEHIKMDAFGAFSNRLIGPFGWYERGVRP